MRSGVLERQAAVPGDEVDHHLGIIGGVEDRTLIEHLLTHRLGVGEVTVVRERQDPLVGAHGEGLRVEAQRRARRGVARVPNPYSRTRESQLLQAPLVKDLRDQPHILLDHEFVPVRDGDAARFLTPVLQGEDAKIAESGDIGGFRLIDREDATLLMRFVEVVGQNVLR